MQKDHEVIASYPRVILKLKYIYGWDGRKGICYSSPGAVAVVAQDKVK